MNTSRLYRVIIFDRAANRRITLPIPRTEADLEQLSERFEVTAWPLPCEQDADHIVSALVRLTRQAREQKNPSLSKRAEKALEQLLGGQ